MNLVELFSEKLNSYRDNASRVEKKTECDASLSVNPFQACTEDPKPWSRLHKELKQQKVILFCMENRDKYKLVFAAYSLLKKTLLDFLEKKDLVLEYDLEHGRIISVRGVSFEIDHVCGKYMVKYDMK